MIKKPLKIGIVLNSTDVPVWMYKTITKLLFAEYADIKLVVYNTTPDKNKLKIPLFYQWHKKLEQYIFRYRINFNNTVSLSKKLQGIPKTFILSECSDACVKISANQLDVILNFSSIEFQHEKIKLSRFGIWNYTVENQNIFEENTNVYWKMVNKSPVFRVALQNSMYSPNTKTVIHTSWMATNYSSILINLNQAFGLCSQIIPRLIEGIYLYGFDYVNSRSLNHKHHNNITTSLKTWPIPTNKQACINVLRIVFGYLYKKLVTKRNWRWFLMYKFHSSPFPEKLNSYQSLIPPKDRLWADPFVLCHNSHKLIFIEELIYKTNKGHITLLKLDDSGKLISKNKILDKPYHMSYPLVFKYHDNYYMIPETSENNTIEMYKCDDFPNKWSFVMNLKEDIVAMDTTPFYYHNKWWLFTAINETTNTSDHIELFLFFSDDLFTNNWTPHPANPISTDIRNARPAGKIYIHNDKIYRPSQDCSVRYGRAININQITTLTETSYQEILISKTEATWHHGLKGTHTFNFDQNFSIIDVYKY